MIGWERELIANDVVHLAKLDLHHARAFHWAALFQSRKRKVCIAKVHLVVVFEWAYPRSHGATDKGLGELKQTEGLSPLARGNPNAGQRTSV